jgi:hypothetical protein
MPDDNSDLEALSARIAEGTRSLRERANAGPDDENALVADLSAAAAHLRDSTASIGAGLARVIDTPPAAAIETPSRAARTRRRARVDPLTRHAILRGTDKWGPHFYTPVYHELFQHLRELPIRLLEIGVGGHESSLLGGASLLMWADYFPHARIVGVDVGEKRVTPHPRITILQGAQEDAAFLRQVVADHGPFDIVIDDGSHVPAHVRTSFDVLFPSLRDEGFYVIEDVQTAYWPRFGGSPDGAETMGLARAALEAINHAEIQVVDPEWVAPPMARIVRSVRAYHNLLIFQKGDNNEPSSMRRLDGASPYMNDALAVMEAILSATPTADGFAHLARTYSQVRLGDRAVATVRRGLSQWPDDVHLLIVGAKVARRWPDEALHKHCLERLAAVAADDPLAQELIRSG